MANAEKPQLGISHPGTSSSLISPSDAIKRDPDFFARRPETVNWRLRVRHLDGTIEEMAPGTDWEVISRFGSVRSAVATNPDGSPAFDRPRYDEAPNINAVVWGRDKKTGEIKIGIISQARPHADNVFEDSDKPMAFESVPMGFMDKVVGKDQVERLEHAGEAATREAGEETGALAVKDISYPEYPNHYPNPTFVGTTSSVVFVEVDLDKVDEMKIDRTEQIFSAEYVPLSQVLKDGFSYPVGKACSVLFKYS
ncbi:MAG: NUDIX domain-containing protein [Patescibacteria group bacterium]|nr:NUDIX domain-containing protein [Patescibacteria group bacterium]